MGMPFAENAGGQHVPQLSPNRLRHLLLRAAYTASEVFQEGPWGADSGPVEQRTGEGRYIGTSLSSACQICQIPCVGAVPRADRFRDFGQMLSREPNHGLVIPRARFRLSTPGTGSVLPETFDSLLRPRPAWPSPSPAPRSNGVEFATATGDANLLRGSLDKQHLDPVPVRLEEVAALLGAAFGDHCLDAIIPTAQAFPAITLLHG